MSFPRFLRPYTFSPTHLSKGDKNRISALSNPLFYQSTKPASLCEAPRLQGVPVGHREGTKPPCCLLQVPRYISAGRGADSYGVARNGFQRAQNGSEAGQGKSMSRSAPTITSNLAKMPARDKAATSGSASLKLERFGLLRENVFGGPSGATIGVTQRKDANLTRTGKSFLVKACRGSTPASYAIRVTSRPRRYFSGCGR